MQGQDGAVKGEIDGKNWADSQFSSKYNGIYNHDTKTSNKALGQRPVVQSVSKLWLKGKAAASLSHSPWACHSQGQRG